VWSSGKPACRLIGLGPLRWTGGHTGRSSNQLIETHWSDRISGYGQWRSNLIEAFQRFRYRRPTQSCWMDARLRILPDDVSFQSRQYKCACGWRCVPNRWTLCLPIYTCIRRQKSPHFTSSSTTAITGGHNTPYTRSQILSIFGAL